MCAPLPSAQIERRCPTLEVIIVVVQAKAIEAGLGADLGHPPPLCDALALALLPRALFSALLVEADPARRNVVAIKLIRRAPLKVAGTLGAALADSPAGFDLDALNLVIRH